MLTDICRVSDTVAGAVVVLWIDEWLLQMHRQVVTTVLRLSTRTSG